MHRFTVVAAFLAACFWAMPASASSSWAGTADYTAATSSAGDEESVGPFSRYDFGSGVALFEATGNVGNSRYYNGYFQSFVTRHELNGVAVASPLLDSSYELTISASFSQVITNLAAGFDSIAVNPGGVVSLYLDTTVDRNYATDQGFTDGDVILSGVIQGGMGSISSFGSQAFGVTDLEILITGFNHDVFAPADIVAGSSIFTLRLNSPFDAGYIDPIPSVMGHAYDPAAGDLKYAVDGYVDLAAAPVPEADTYALMLAGLAMIAVIGYRQRMR